MTEHPADLTAPTTPTSAAPSRVTSARSSAKSLSLVAKLQSLPEIPPPQFSDGIETGHPQNTSPNQPPEHLNYYRPFEPTEQKVVVWLSKLATTTYSNAKHLRPEFVNQNRSPNGTNDAGEPSTSTDRGQSSSSANPDETALVLRKAQSTPGTEKLPEAPPIPVNAHEKEYVVRFSDFPAGYKLYEHTFEVKKDIANFREDGEKPRVRRDPYLFGTRFTCLPTTKAVVAHKICDDAG